MVGQPHIVDTSARSLVHWSEESRPEMDSFYALASQDYQELAAAADWAGLLRSQAKPGWRLLDVACGSGKFPRALLAGGGLNGVPAVQYDVLDPSAFSVSEARAQLAFPFEPGDSFVQDLQDLPEVQPYDVVWATHALYALPLADLPQAAANLRRALRPDGLGVVAQATAASHYLVFYDAYRAGVVEATPFTSAEQVADALRAAGADVREERRQYVTGTSDRRVVEGFLQRCAFDDTVTLEQMESAPVLGDYLASCRAPSGSYQFEHEVALLWM